MLAVLGILGLGQSVNVTIPKMHMILQYYYLLSRKDATRFPVAVIDH